MRSRAPEYVDSEWANGTYLVVIGGRLSDANAPRPWYASRNVSRLHSSPPVGAWHRPQRVMRSDVTPSTNAHDTEAMPRHLDRQSGSAYVTCDFDDLSRIP